ncbi:MAG: 30S ribosome-binding factor RbfA [Bacteroides sp.]|nr:30S ribosome-binding factor RbfA [Bacillota bacterium]MCM1393863.1 30S ribosome-binding factor RbfA [[Eubacterium] siraeum]MCM1455806.1 30S ribosome-binding factor RbfA [Bacteroides sp.]
MKIKMERINAELARQIAKVISEDIKDPRLGDAIIGVTKVRTTPDLKYAKVYVSVYAPSKELVTEAYYTVCRASTFIRNRLKDCVQMRLLPELTFVLDETEEHSVVIENLLARIKNSQNGQPVENSTDEE